MEVIIIQSDNRTLKNLLSMDVAKRPLYSLTNIHQLLHNSISTLLLKQHTTKCRDRLQIGVVKGNKVWVLLKTRGFYN
jgi:hypothetical protein